MKRIHLFALSVLVVGVQGVAHAAYPSDAEAVSSLPEATSFQAWGVSLRPVKAHDPFPFGGGYIDD